MPPSPYRVTFAVQPAYRDRVRTRTLSSTVRRALAAERVATPSEVSVVVTSDAVVRDLNRRFRSEDSATDVLSFNLHDDPRFATGRGVPQLGEVVISFPTARRQARAAGHTVDAEIEHLLVHGVLHLLGYDHERIRDANAMRAREEALLGREAH